VVHNSGVGKPKPAFANGDGTSIRRGFFTPLPKTRCCSEVCLKSYYFKTTLSRLASIAQRTRESVDPRLSLWEVKDLGSDDLMLNWVKDRLVSYVQDWSDELPVLRKP